MFKKATVSFGAALLALTLIPSSTRAQENPFQIAFIGPTMQLVDDDADVMGVRLNILYGVNRNVYGLDVGLVNRATGEMKAWQLGLVGMAESSFTGWQDNFVNVTRGAFLGLQSGLVNVVGSGEGVQLGGVFNQAERMSGLQFALVNVADDMFGLQIGLINIIRSKENLPILPLVNWKYDQ